MDYQADYLEAFLDAMKHWQTPDDARSHDRTICENKMRDALCENRAVVSSEIEEADVDDDGYPPGTTILHCSIGGDGVAHMISGPHVCFVEYSSLCVTQLLWGYGQSGLILRECDETRLTLAETLSRLRRQVYEENDLW